jgi:ATP-dependent Clp protease ATP-binding subunit ClpA
MFKPLLPLEIIQVTKLLMEQEKENLKEKGIELSYTDIVLEELTELGYNPVYGAREMKRVIQEKIEDRIANMIIEKELGSGQAVLFNTLEDVEIK